MDHGKLFVSGCQESCSVRKARKKHVQEYTHFIDSLAMPGFWREIVDIAVGGALAESVLEEYCDIVEIVWKRLRYILEPHSDVAMESMVDSWLAIDKLFVT
jgi:hypothetical protein